MPFLKISVASACRMWIAGQNDDIVNLTNGLEWKSERQWLKLISDHKRASTPKRAPKVCIGWRYPRPYAWA